MRNTEVAILKNACPICKGDLAGNFYIKFLCRKCMINFSVKDLSQGLFWMQHRSESYRF